MAFVRIQYVWHMIFAMQMCVASGVALWYRLPVWNTVTTPLTIRPRFFPATLNPNPLFLAHWKGNAGSA